MVQITINPGKSVCTSAWTSRVHNSVCLFSKWSWCQCSGLCCLWLIIKKQSLPYMWWLHDWSLKLRWLAEEYSDTSRNKYIVPRKLFFATTERGQGGRIKPGRVRMPGCWLKLMLFQSPLGKQWPHMPLHLHPFCRSLGHALLGVHVSLS